MRRAIYLCRGAAVRAVEAATAGCTQPLSGCCRKGFAASRELSWQFALSPFSPGQAAGRYEASAPPAFEPPPKLKPPPDTPAEAAGMSRQSRRYMPLPHFSQLADDE